MLARLLPSLWMLAWQLVLLSPLFAALLAILSYNRHCRRRPNPARRVPILLFMFAVIIAGVVAFIFGILEGNAWACSSPSAGNLCGLVGIFLYGPLAAAVAIAGVGGLILLL